jgi:hypothetical protein
MVKLRKTVSTIPVKHEIGAIPSINNVCHVSGGPNFYPLSISYRITCLGSCEISFVRYSDM